MPDVCIGCGLTTDDNGNLVAATAGEWGDSSLPYTCDDTSGEPIYCDSTGVLRTAPKHVFAAGVRGICRPDAVFAFAPGSGLNTFGDGGALLDTGYGLAVVNPSACRNAAFQLFDTLTVNIRYLQTGQINFIVTFYESIDGGAFNLVKSVQYVRTVSTNDSEQVACEPTGDTHYTSPSGTFSVASRIGVQVFTAPTGASAIGVNGFCLAQRVSGHSV